jgi:hypothetical protein
LIYSSENGEKPWFSSCCLMALMDIFMVGWILRLKLNASTKIVNYRLDKYIIR